MEVRTTMDDYLLWGALVALLLLVLLLAVQLIRRRARRPVARRERADPSPARASSPASRSASERDTASDVHALRPAAREDARLRAEREAAEQAARAESAREADREAAEWEARLLAQHLADEERERSLIAAALADPVAAPAPVLPEPTPVVDEQAALDVLAREAAEWEARLAAQQLAAVESERQRVAAEAKRVAAEAAAARAAAVAAQIEAEREAEGRVQEEAAVAAPPLREVAVARTPEQCLVMIADDSKVVRIKTSRLLAKHLYRVSLAEDGLDAARQIELNLPDVLITDVEMPGMDGFALTRRMRANPRTAHIPIVMITADDVKHRADAFEAGVSVLLSKPYPEDQLLAYLQSTLACSAACP